MKEFIDKLIGRLEEELKTTREIQTTQCKGNNGYGTPLQSKLSGEISALLKVENIVNQLAEEYKNIENKTIKTDKFNRMIETFECDFWGAKEKRRSLVMLDKLIENEDTTLLNDIDLLSELSYLLRNKKAEIHLVESSK